MDTADTTALPTGRHGNHTQKGKTVKMNKRLKWVAIPLAAVSLLAASCGGGSSEVTSAEPAEETAEEAATEADSSTEEATENTGEASGEPIKLGFLAALSGPAAPWGQAELEAAEVVVADINANGGVLGRPIELVIEDDTTNPTETARLAQSLVEQGVVAIVGPNFGSAALAGAPITNDAQVPIVAMVGTMGVTSPEQEFFPYTFRSAVSDELAIPAIWERLQQQGHTRIAVFAEDSAYGELGIKGFTDLANETEGMELVSTAVAAQDAADVTAQATKLRDADPDAIVLQTGIVGLTANFVRAAENVGLDVPMLGGLGLSQAALIDALGSDVPQLQTLNMFNPHNPTPKQQELIDLMEAEGYEASGFANILGANGVVILTTAIEEAGEASGPAIVEALESGMEIEAYALAPYRFGPDDHTGLSPEAVVWTTIEGGRFTTVE